MKKLFCLGALLLLFSVGLFSHEYIIDKNPTRSWNFGGYWNGNIKVGYASLTGGNWDNGYYDLALPSINQFYFYGRKVTHLRITTNGYIIPGFGSPSGTVQHINDPIPDTSSPHPVIAVLWDDWDLSAQGEIWYGFNGEFTIVEWRGVLHKGASLYMYNTFVAVFIGNDQWQLPNSFFFQYQDVKPGTIWDNGVSATIGVEHPGGTQGDEYSYNTASIQDEDILLFSPFVPIYDNTDGWGDGYPDPLVFRPDNGMWFISRNPLSGTSPSESKQFGVKNDIAVPGDYDGSGYWDLGVYRPSTSQWFTDGAVTDFSVQWGRSGDIPVPADWDGDGDTDLGVFRPQYGLWFIYYLPAGTSTSIQWGTDGDVPIPGDYDNDGITDIAVYRPSNTVWYIRRSSNPALSYEFPWGTDGDIPMPANFQTGSYSTACVYRPSTGQWYSYNQINGSTFTLGPWGASSDVPVPNDWNADGASDATVFRPEVGMWYILGWPAFQWGQLGDKPRCRRSTQIVAPPPDTNSSATDSTGVTKK